MTTKARTVLQDVKVAIGLHGDHLSGEAFRVSWFGIVGLLRAIGHVLSKVDADSDPALKKAINQKWLELQQSKPEPTIFWGFIEEERNRFLKNYEHGITRLKVFKLGSTQGGLSLDLANSRNGFTQCLSLPQIPDEIKDRTTVSFITDGPFAGRNEKEIAQEACQWWDSYLTDIERIAGSYRAV